jgi:hypothetical protein
MQETTLRNNVHTNVSYSTLLCSLQLPAVACVNKGHHQPAEKLRCTHVAALCLTATAATISS